MQNRRKHDRSTKDVDVRLYKNEEFMSLAKSLDLTPYGIFLQTDVLLFPKGTQLKIAIDDPDNLKRYQKMGTIVHRSLKGIGVQFQQEDTEDNNSNFMRLLNRARPPAHAAETNIEQYTHP